ncbi:hypothetical protein MRB53_039863 [Persea americana]|nr:hypothetical protein MRB53_039863 [Persea americana]
MPTTLALVPKVTADQFRGNSLQSTQQASPIHTTSSVWRPSHTRRYSSSSAILSKRIADGRTPSNNDKSQQADATTDSRTFSQRNSSTSPGVAKTDHEDTDTSTPDLSITVNDFLCHSFVRRANGTIAYITRVRLLTRLKKG